jgi:hypothetical protein
MEVFMARKITPTSSRKTSGAKGRTGKSTNQRTGKVKQLLQNPITDKRVTYHSFFKRLGTNPLTYYLGGGVAALILARLGYKYYKGHPEIKDFIKENFDSVESKFREYKESLTADDSQARH